MYILTDMGIKCKVRQDLASLEVENGFKWTAIETKNISVNNKIPCIFIIVYCTPDSSLVNFLFYLDA